MERLTLYTVDFTSAMEPDDLELLREYAHSIDCVGSRTIKGGYHAGSDYDFLVEMSGDIYEVLTDMEFELEGDSEHYEPNQGEFNSWRKGNINLVVTSSTLFKLKFLAANNLVRQLGLKKRPERVKIFQRILYGVK